MNEDPIPSPPGSWLLDNDIDRVDWQLAKAALAADRFDNGRSHAALELSFRRSSHTVFAWGDAVLVGMARLLSDGVCNAYLLDVWTHSSWRGRGIGAAMVQRLVEEVPGQHIGLQTDDAEAFYSGLGFSREETFLWKVAGRWLDNPANR